MWQCIVLPITIKHVIQIQFLQNHTIVLVLGDDGQVVGVNHKTLNTEFYISRSAQFIKSFSISGNHKGNKRISCTMSDGTIEILSIPSLLKQHQKTNKLVQSQNSDTMDPSKWDIHSVMVKPPTLSTVNLCSISKETNENEDNIQSTKSLREKSGNALKALNAAAIASKLSVHKLRDYLTVNGCFADKYRVIAWKFLLNLPNLKGVYDHHQRKGIHPQWERKLNSHSMGTDVILDVHSRSKQRLLRILSLLSHWCTLCQHIEFLPSFIYPFVRLYGKKEIECFECILFILCKYSSEWFLDFPDAPLNILSFWVSSMRHFDVKLYSHFQHHMINIEQYFWRMLTTGFSTIFSESEWLSIWDHVLVNEPLFLHLLPIAIVLCSKTAFYSMHCKLSSGHVFKLLVFRIHV